MNKNTYKKTAGIVFSVVAVVHAFRILYNWDVVIGGWMMPMWLSWVVVVLIGWMAWAGLKK